MSLINQMLKDLEQRGAGSSDASKISPSPLEFSATPKNSFPFVKLALILVLLAGGYYSWQRSSNIEQQVNNGKIATPADIKPQPIINSPVNNPPVAAVPAPTIDPVTSETPPVNTVPLFETELKYTPTETSTSIKNVVKEKSEIKEKSLTKEKAIEKENKVETEKTAKEINAAITLIETGPTTTTKPVEKPSVIAPLPAGKRYSNKLSTKLSNEAPNTGKEIRPEQRSSNLYRQALSNLQQGRVSEAQDNLAQSLEANPANQEARQTLAGLLLDNKRNDEAKATLAAGLALAPEQNDFRMALARLQVEAGDRSAALATLEQGLPYAKNNSEYYSFTATMLQRAERHDEAVKYYKTALSINASNPSALIGLGISSQALGNMDAAKEAYTRAQTNTTLTPELSAFVEQRLKQINQKSRN
jgi:MSHA biogenesis protein MshN